MDYKEIVGIAVLILATIGAAWKWGFAEWLRIRSEIPTLDGELKIGIVSISPERTVVEIKSVWRNKGSVPVFLNTQKTRADIFDLSDDPEGNVDFEARTPHLVIRPISQVSMYFLEPKTDSEIICCCVLRTDRIYGIRFRLSAPISSFTRRMINRNLRSFSGKPIQLTSVRFERTQVVSTANSKK